MFLISTSGFVLITPQIILWLFPFIFLKFPLWISPCIAIQRCIFLNFTHLLAMLVGYDVLSFSSICQLSSRHNPPPTHKSQWYHWDCFYLFVPTIQGNLVLPLSASVERCQKPLFVPAHDFIYSWKGLAPFSLFHSALFTRAAFIWSSFTGLKQSSLVYLYSYLLIILLLNLSY